MKQMLAVSIVLLTGGAAAGAQTYDCSRPAEPYIPDGHVAEYHQMELAELDLEDYLDDMDDYLACLAAEHRDAEAEIDSVIEEWDDTARIYDAR
jgi:hypothetical protein